MDDPRASDGRLPADVAQDIEGGEDPRHPLRRLLARLRRRIDRYPRLRTVYRVVVGIIGGSVAVLGLALVPLPGPGWLVVFLGLAVLGTEFAWARRSAARLKRLLARFWAWWRARRDRTRTSPADGAG
ncbi:TIGR02611 family protein [Labedella gwakjiensis]|uniref:TIGR02611 family protein n=1 Tax=Labedella gwakjiensis TaxID=390269 RepID=A0ABY0CA76_9MICO|nr:TIGR02611 family protein [Labedella gwakjiensis]RUQ86895.1 TIGR02611 family protein [Labedella gwakjiensis]